MDTVKLDAPPPQRYLDCHRRRLCLRVEPLWCADFKGEFKLGNGRYCFPLTVTDHASRYLLLCEALESTRETLAITAFELLFQERGLPQATPVRWYECRRFEAMASPTLTRCPGMTPILLARCQCLA